MIERFPTITVHEFQENPYTVYEMAEEHPVVLLNDHEPKLVCLTPDEWNKIDQLLGDQEDMIAALEAELAIALGEETEEIVTDLDTFFEEMMGDDVEDSDVIERKPIQMIDVDVEQIRSHRGVPNLVPV
ncbi:MAG: hypothetical protein AAF639_10070 [Chloroflexota bacterium]